MNNDESFWIPKPHKIDLMTISIVVPVLASGIGLFLMGIESMVFAQFESLPNEYRIYTSIFSAVLLAFGGEIGSVSNNVFLFSKYIKSKMQNRFEWDIVTYWEWIGFAVSWIATTLSMFIASSTRPNMVTGWKNFTSEWLLVPLMILAVSDIIFGTIETGVHLGTFDLRMMDWIVRKKQWQDETQRKRLLEQSLNIKIGGTQPLPTVKEEAALRCWCGKIVKSQRAYNAHLRLHKNEVQQHSDAQSALTALKSKYGLVENANFAFPGLSDIAEWRS